MGEEGFVPEVVQVGLGTGITVERRQTVGGSAGFETTAGSVTAAVYKARTPDVGLEGVWVYLVQRLVGEEPVDEYALMVDDPYWGRAISPGEFAAVPLAETFVMGRRVKGRILQDGEPVAGANVSLEGVCEIEGVGEARFWDSLEYNELIWSDELETYVEGAVVYAPIMTGGDGRWEFICPKGYGAIYRKDSDGGLTPGPSFSEDCGPAAPGREGNGTATAEDAGRRLKALWAVYRGRKAELEEEVEAVIDLLSGRLEISGEPGCLVRVGTMDDAGTNYAVGGEGTVVVEGLPSGPHSVVQWRDNGWGGWDASVGCARQSVEVAEGETTTVALGTMTTPPEGMIAGRIYERPGVPAAGIAVVPINFETGEVGAAIAQTDGGGYWEAEIPEAGFGGDPWVMDSQWGSVPLLGYPYSDVVLGARAYASWLELWKPEAWRKGDRGHANFQWVPGVLWLEAEDGERYGTEEAAYGGWVTAEALPKYRYVGEVGELLSGGPQLREYALKTAERTLVAEITLGSQSFEDYETLPGQYRAAGWYPEAKFLLGGKIKGSAVVQNEEPIGLELAEAHRIGLEFGRHEWLTQVTAEGEGLTTCWTDLVCPYCGGPTWRDPDGGGLRRGFCVQCAVCFGIGEAMDGRTHFVTPAVPPASVGGKLRMPPAGAGDGGLTPGPSPSEDLGRGENGAETAGMPVDTGTAADNSYRLRTLVVRRGGGSESCAFGFWWRPDLYDETEDFLTQNAPGQATNAPRWLARHVDERGDGLGFGRFEDAISPPFTVGHDLGYFGSLPEVQRALGLAQMKLVFPWGYAQAETVTIELDCVRGDDATETVRIQVPAGTRGGGDGRLSDAVPLLDCDKIVAEAKGAPYAGCGFYKAITGARLVGGGECRFTIVNDTPLLAGTTGVWVVEGKAALVALQTGVLPAGSGPHLMDDAVGQVFLFYARDGRIWMKRRRGLPAAWEETQAVTEGPDDRHPCAEKDDRGRLRLVWQRGGETVVAVSGDDGEAWA